MTQSIILNIPDSLTADESEAVLSVYKSMDGWLAAQNGYFWYGNSPDTPYIYASSVTNGLEVIGCVDEVLWLGWITKFCAKLSITLNREIYDVLMT